MNKVIETLINHRSIRSYKKDSVSKEYLDIIIKSAQAAPSSINGQQMSIISVEDEEKKKKIAHLVGDQAWVDQAPVFLIFCADFYRAKLGLELNNQEMVITDNIESTLVGAVDVGIAMSNAITAAESLGLGTVPIGGVRKNPDELIELLELPPYVFPICGLVIGHIEDNSHLKPRFPKEAVHHEEKYNNDLIDNVKEYDETVSNYMKERTNGEDSRNWSQTVSRVYNHVYYPKVSDALKKQGFKNL
ncbi:NADPH-dependent oxidoreductase [Tepidibacter aestuarii]|uniref:NADPH-dependent oxidoreductase n=1 Tax=Tepidibacter aestuarii TaxID=2925782 RepID=UPI0020BD567F|nr:NADPH-dependent oxidoreductase [Tepidibacter aestuarii]CAH2214903.1 NADPH-FMN oxidoreductase (nitroreductase) [Tepidibacter aestuarii]